MPEQGSITYALCTDLSGAAAAAVRYLWQNLEARYGLRAAQTTEKPHVTFSVFNAALEQEAELLEALAAAAIRVEPFSLFLDGLSSMSGENRQEVFIRVVKGDETEVAFNTIWRTILDLGVMVRQDYHPGAWSPRCVLAGNDLKPERLQTVRHYLRTQVVSWRSATKTMSLYRVTPGGLELAGTWALGEEAPAVNVSYFAQQ